MAGEMGASGVSQNEGLAKEAILQFGRKHAALVEARRIVWTWN